MPNCGECLWNTQDITELDARGKCPKCGADYGPFRLNPTIQAQLDAGRAEAKRKLKARKP